MAVDDADALRRARLFVGAQVQSTPEQFDALALKGIRVVAASRGRCLCEFTCDAGKLNRFRTLHGGCISTLVDVIGSAGIITVTNVGGVTLALHTIMLQPGRENEQVLVDARTLKVGKQIATVEVELRSKNDDGSPGHLIAKGTHVKALVPQSDLSALFERELERGQQSIAGDSSNMPKPQPPRSRL